ncbi:histidinol-phosphate transaminase [Chitinophagaceae bacterium MMS25-I14]
MTTFNPAQFFRKNILELQPYSSARSEFTGAATVFLDANENNMNAAIGNSYSRYPDPLQRTLKQQLSAMKKIAVENILITNGSDEAIDLLIRAACIPGTDNVLICPPTYGMYEVAARINDVEVREVLMTKDFQPDIEQVLQAADEQTKMLFICSPNNPTGNLIKPELIKTLLDTFKGLVVLDEAYIDFSLQDSWISRLGQYPNLVILQTLSKAWGIAGLRVGIAYASASIISILHKLKPPYNVNEASQQLALQALRNNSKTEGQVANIIHERNLLAERLKAFSFVTEIFPSDANFLLVRVNDAGNIYQYLLEKGIVVRNRSSQLLCENCLRITAGTAAENELLLKQLETFNG